MKINPEGPPTGSTPNQGPISPEPIDVLQANIEKLLANQRTPGTVEVPRWLHWLNAVAALLVLVGVTLILLFGFHGLLLRHDDGLPAHPAVHAVANVTSTSDAQLAADLTAACHRHPGGCGATPTPTEIPSYVAYVCQALVQPVQPAGNAAWYAAWREIGEIVADSGRCLDPSDRQLAAELADLPSASGHPMDPTTLAEMVKLACPRVGGSVPHTPGAAAVLRVIAASGRCGR